MKQLTVGFALCGSFCTFSQALPQMQNLLDAGYRVLPMMSPNASTTDTRFGKAAEFIEKIEQMCGQKVLRTILEAEPVGPKKLVDVLLIAPCTGNTLSKLANGITDTCVTMAAKSHLRVQRPVVLALATNDALGASAQNLGKLLNVKNVYFVPLSQDDPEKKPNSLVAHFDLILPSVEAALNGEQLQPVFVKGA